MGNELLKRETFTTNRTLEFFTEKELTMQIGHSRLWWPIAIVKELIDNSLDACESAGILPEIEVKVDEDGVSVRDNGPGLPEDTLKRSLDYMIRVSDKNHYVSPSRGQLGNALKCVYAVPFVMDGELAFVDIATCGKTHRIEITLDRIAQKPKLEHTVSDDGFVKNGTFVKIYGREIASYLENPESYDSYNSPPNIISLIGHYLAFNPHASLTYRDQKRHVRSDRSTSDWRKWCPSDPTSIYWYSLERLQGLIAAYLNIEREGGKPKTVRELISEFKGLTSTIKQKKVSEVADLGRAYLHDLIRGGNVDEIAVLSLMDAMSEHSKPVKSKALGIIGEKHFQEWMIQDGISEDSINYKMITGESKENPFVLEVAFGVFNDEYAELGREIVTGLNWSPALSMPFVELSYLLGEVRVNAHDPVCVIVHLACPRLDFTDRGKSKLHLSDEAKTALEKAIGLVTKAFTVAKRKADRENRLRDHQLEKLRKAEKNLKLSVKDAAFMVMEEAYMKASADNTLPANARQIMYAARPLIIELTEKSKPWSHSSYFTQTLLPDFITENPDLTSKWDVVYDARGKFIEPHTGKRVDLGTLDVRRYINNWTNDGFISAINDVSLSHAIDTHGPDNRYRFVLFVEKEGFDELWKSINLASRFDLAIMSTKGMSVTAARHLVENLTEKGVTVFVLRDFDKAGFSIVHTLHSDTKRWKFKSTPNVVDLGLRLEDVLKMDLDTEDVAYDSKVDPRFNLLDSGATEEEANFLVEGGRPGSWHGKRVELNAMTSGQLVDWLEKKLKDVGVKKVVPDADVLKRAYLRAHRIAHIQNAIQDAVKSYSGNGIRIPGNVQELVRTKTDDTATAWDDAIYEIANGYDRQD